MTDLSLIFDMDGVIADTGDLHEKAWFEYCETHKIHITSALFRNQLFGRSSRETFEILLDRKLSDDELKAFIDEKEKLFRKYATGKLHALPGLVQFLESANHAGIKIGVASSAPLLNVKFTLRETETEKYFDYITSAGEVKRSKPDPSIFLLSAKKMNVTPDRCLVFEDSFAGIEAAEKAGMKVIMLATTHTTGELPRNHPAISDFSCLTIEFISRLFEESAD